jgi:hypothetical protein
MTKHLLAVVAALALMSGVAYAEPYPPAPPPSTPLAPPPAVTSPGAVNPPAVTPGPSTSITTTVSPTPGGDHQELTIHKEVDEKGNTAIEKDTHREGLTGSSESQRKQ